jgi:hypothetical protein
MKYLAIILSIFLISCNNEYSEDPHYALVSNIIDSVKLENDRVNSIEQNLKPGDDLLPYADAQIARYTFAKMYEMEINKVEPLEKRNELILKYNLEIKTEPNKLLPTGMFVPMKEAILNEHSQQ